MVGDNFLTSAGGRIVILGFQSGLQDGILSKSPVIHLGYDQVAVSGLTGRQQVELQRWPIGVYSNGLLLVRDTKMCLTYTIYIYNYIYI